MGIEQLRTELSSQIAYFYERHGNSSVDRIVFDTMDGEHCLRVSIGTSREGQSVNWGYSPHEFGYTSREELRVGVMQVLAEEHGFKYKQPERRSVLEMLIPALID